MLPRRPEIPASSRVTRRLVFLEVILLLHDYLGQTSTSCGCTFFVPPNLSAPASLMSPSCPDAHNASLRAELETLSSSSTADVALEEDGDGGRLAQRQITIATAVATRGVPSVSRRGDPVARASSPPQLHDAACEASSVRGSGSASVRRHCAPTRVRAATPLPSHPRCCLDSARVACSASHTASRFHFHKPRRALPARPLLDVRPRVRPTCSNNRPLPVATPCPTSHSVHWHHGADASASAILRKRHSCPSRTPSTTTYRSPPPTCVPAIHYPRCPLPHLRTRRHVIPVELLSASTARTHGPSLRRRLAHSPAPRPLAQPPRVRGPLPPLASVCPASHTAARALLPCACPRPLPSLRAAASSPYARSAASTPPSRPPPALLPRPSHTRLDPCLRVDTPAHSPHPIPRSRPSPAPVVAHRLRVYSLVCFTTAPHTPCPRPHLATAAVSAPHPPRVALLSLASTPVPLRITLAVYFRARVSPHPLTLRDHTPARVSPPPLPRHGRSSLPPHYARARTRLCPDAPAAFRRQPPPTPRYPRSGSVPRVRYSHLTVSAAPPHATVALPRQQLSPCACILAHDSTSRCSTTVHWISTPARPLLPPSLLLPGFSDTLLLNSPHLLTTSVSSLYAC
ncbi:hypothetical protein B0H14DRAFT_3531400 [Mycena olivaceomarginata]|nr:hypothetical protein B0H14DRAFT_3531400 [Mycena olivaceomarginata]